MKNFLTTVISNLKNPGMDELLAFEAEKQLIMPKDLKEYFITLNGTNNEYNENMYRFFSFSRFLSIDSELKNFNGVPDYSNLVNALENYKDCFVFADYLFHMFTYAIRLYKNESQENEIYILCGERYKVIAKNFSQFAQLYQEQSIELQFGE